MGKDLHHVKRILFATDFSSCANHAEEYVGFLARAYGAKVDVIHVLEIYEGTYITTIQDHRETDERLDCHLIVMGTHGRRGISHVLKGSVAEGVLRRAPCPVLAMKSLPFATDHRRLGPL